MASESDHVINVSFEDLLQDCQEGDESLMTDDHDVFDDTLLDELSLMPQPLTTMDQSQIFVSIPDSICQSAPSSPGVVSGIIALEQTPPQVARVIQASLLTTPHIYAMASMNITTPLTGPPPMAMQLLQSPIVMPIPIPTIGPVAPIAIPVSIPIPVPIPIQPRIIQGIPILTQIIQRAANPPTDFIPPIVTQSQPFRMSTPKPSDTPEVLNELPADQTCPKIPPIGTRAGVLSDGRYPANPGDQYPPYKKINRGRDPKSNRASDLRVPTFSDTGVRSDSSAESPSGQHTAHAPRPTPDMDLPFTVDSHKPQMAKQTKKALKAHPGFQNNVPLPLPSSEAHRQSADSLFALMPPPRSTSPTAPTKRGRSPSQPRRTSPLDTYQHGAFGAVNPVTPILLWDMRTVIPKRGQQYRNEQHGLAALNDRFDTCVVPPAYRPELDRCRFAKRFFCPLCPFGSAVGCPYDSIPFTQSRIYFDMFDLYIHIQAYHYPFITSARCIAPNCDKQYFHTIAMERHLSQPDPLHDHFYANHCSTADTPEGRVAFYHSHKSEFLSPSQQFNLKYTPPLWPVCLPIRVADSRVITAGPFRIAYQLFADYVYGQSVEQLDYIPFFHDLRQEGIKYTEYKRVIVGAGFRGSILRDGALVWRLPLNLENLLGQSLDYRLTHDHFMAYWTDEKVRNELRGHPHSDIVTNPLTTLRRSYVPEPRPSKPISLPTTIYHRSSTNEASKRTRSRSRTRHDRSTKSDAIPKSIQPKPHTSSKPTPSPTTVTKMTATTSVSSFGARDYRYLSQDSGATNASPDDGDAHVLPADRDEPMPLNSPAIPPLMALTPKQRDPYQQMSVDQDRPQTSQTQSSHTEATQHIPFTDPLDLRLYGPRQSSSDYTRGDWIDTALTPIDDNHAETMFLDPMTGIPVPLYMPMADARQALFPDLLQSRFPSLPTPTDFSHTIGRPQLSERLTDDVMEALDAHLLNPALRERADPNFPTRDLEPSRIGVLMANLVDLGQLRVNLEQVQQHAMTRAFEAVQRHSLLQGFSAATYNLTRPDRTTLSHIHHLEDENKTLTAQVETLQADKTILTEAVQQAQTTSAVNEQQLAIINQTQTELAATRTTVLELTHQLEQQSTTVPLQYQSAINIQPALVHYWQRNTTPLQYATDYDYVANYCQSARLPLPPTIPPRHPLHSLYMTPTQGHLPPPIRPPPTPQPPPPQ